MLDGTVLQNPFETSLYIFAPSNVVFAKKVVECPVYPPEVSMRYKDLIEFPGRIS